MRHASIVGFIGDIMSFSRDLAEFSNGELVRMATEGWTSRTVVAVTAAIDRSFDEDAVLRPVRTQDEIKRRFRICIEAMCVLRRDLHWSMPRILDEIPRALRAKLDGAEWNPETERKTWVGSEAEAQGKVDGDDMAPEVEDAAGIETDSES